MLNKTNKRILYIFLILSLMGIIDSSYLTWHHYANLLVPCSTGGCEVVLTSQYSQMFGIPIAAFGIVYYASVFIGALLCLKFDKQKLLDYLSYFTATGFIASALFVYIQIAILHSICTYCMISAGTSTLLFVAGMSHILKGNKNNENSSQ